MTEKVILKETVTQSKPAVEKKPRKKYYKPKKKKEEEVYDQLENSEKPFIPNSEFKAHNTVGRYYIGGGKKFSIHLDKKPKWLHRKCMELFLGWTWEDNK
jgi:hypothetical protein